MDKLCTFNRKLILVLINARLVLQSLYGRAHLTSVSLLERLLMLRRLLFSRISQDAARRCPKALPMRTCGMRIEHVTQPILCNRTFVRDPCTISRCNEPHTQNARVIRHVSRIENVPRKSASPLQLNDGRSAADESEELLLDMKCTREDRDNETERGRRSKGVCV
jgi:hypothetical protein